MDYLQIKSIDVKVVMFRTHEDVVSVRGSLYEAARKWWNISLGHAKRADYVFAVIDGVVREIYEIIGAHSEMDDGSAYPHFDTARLVFDFSLAPDIIRKKYKDKILPPEYQKWGQNPVRFTFK